MFSDLFDDLFEHNDVSSSFSLGKIILIFYIIASSSALFPLLSKQWKTVLENDRIAQHILAIMTMLSIVILVSNGNFSLQRIFSYTVIGYLMFVFTTKMDLHFTIMTFGILLGFYLYQNIIQRESSKISEDTNLTHIQKINLQKEKQNKYLYLVGGTVIMTAIGAILYSNKKEGQYGGGYSLTNFLIYELLTA